MLFFIFFNKILKYIHEDDLNQSFIRILLFTIYFVDFLFERVLDRVNFGIYSTKKGKSKKKERNNPNYQGCPILIEFRMV